MVFSRLTLSRINLLSYQGKSSRKLLAQAFIPTCFFLMKISYPKISRISGLMGLLTCEHANGQLAKSNNYLGRVVLTADKLNLFITRVVILGPGPVPR